MRVAGSQRGVPLGWSESFEDLGVGVAGGAGASGIDVEFAREPKPVEGKEKV